MKTLDPKTCRTIPIRFALRRRNVIHSLTPPRGEREKRLEESLMPLLYSRPLRRNARRFRALCGLTLLAALAPRTQADSLFPVKKANEGLRNSASSTYYSLLSDVRARNVGDVLTVTISESTSASSQAATKASKDESISGFAGTGLFTRLFKDFALTANNSRSANGSGQTTRSGTFNTTISVVVKEVLPNGVLKIEGSRLIQVNKETQKIGFTGLVRPEDIAGDNSVASSLIAQVELLYEGKGMVGDTQHPGILTKIFRYLF